MTVAQPDAQLSLIPEPTAPWAPRIAAAAGDPTALLVIAVEMLTVLASIGAIFDPRDVAMLRADADACQAMIDSDALAGPGFEIDPEAYHWLATRLERLVQRTK